MRKTIVIIGSLAIWGGPAAVTPPRAYGVLLAQKDVHSAAKHQRADYEKAIRAELDSIRSGIRRLESQASSRAHGAKQAFDKRLAALRRQADEAERELARLKASSAAHWASVKARVERSMGDLRKAYRDLSSGAA